MVRPAAGHQRPRLFCLHRSGKLGLGTATIAGMKYAIQHGYRYVLNMDADFSHQPKYLPAILAGMEPADGPPRRDDRLALRPRRRSRGLAPAAPTDEPAVNLYARTLLGLRPKDCSGAYRCYRVAMLSKLDFDAIRSRGYSFQEEILWRLKRLGARFGETPITFIDRRLGARKSTPARRRPRLRIIFTLGLRNWLPCIGGKQ